MALLHRTVTARIRAANRTNARHSTGPRSAAGQKKNPFLTNEAVN